MTSIFTTHPYKFVGMQYTGMLREKANEAESLHRLHDDQLQLIHQQGWLNMYVPKEFNGLELSLPEILRIEEGLAWVDGSVAWVVTLCSGAAWFIGFLHPELRKEVFEEENVCFAGSGGATGSAHILTDGYEINGSWKYASGSLHATVFTANCNIFKGGKPLYNDDGSQLVRPFVLKRNEVVIHKTWNSMGMIATASHSFEVKDLKVPPNRCFTIAASSAVLPHPIYQYPFLQLAETTLAVNLSGMAVRFLDLAEKLLSGRTDTYQLLTSVKHRLEEVRQAFYIAVEASWQQCVMERSVSVSVLKEASEASHTLARVSRALVNEVYPFCGLKAADANEEINRVWRNFQTAGQHALFTRQ